MPRQLHQHLLARDFHDGQLSQPLPQPLQLPFAHRAFLADAIDALCVHIEFAVLGQQFDRDARAGLLPRLSQELFLKPRETPLRRSHQILHRRVATAHFRQHRFGEDATIHHPDTPRATGLLLDLGEEHPQRLAVRSVAGEHLVGQGQTVRGDHQRDHHLRAVRPLVAAVAVATLVALCHVRCVDLEIGAGQIVEQHIEIRVEQVVPARHQMREQCLLVLQQKVMAGVELVRIGQPEVRPQQVGHGAPAEPIAMQLPLAARRDQPVPDQYLQDLIPSRSLAARSQAVAPEAVQLQRLPQLPRQPTGAPLPRPA